MWKIKEYNIKVHKNRNTPCVGIKEYKMFHKYIVAS